MSAWILLFLLKRVAGYLNTPLSSWEHCPALKTERTPKFLSRKNVILTLRNVKDDELIYDIYARKQDIEAALDVLESQMETASLEWIQAQQPILNEMMMEFEVLEKKEREILRRKGQVMRKNQEEVRKGQVAGKEQTLPYFADETEMATEINDMDDILIKDIQMRKQAIEADLDVLEARMTTASLAWVQAQRPVLNEMMMEIRSLEEEERELRKKQRKKMGFWDKLKTGFGF